MNHYLQSLIINKLNKRPGSQIYCYYTKNEKLLSPGVKFGNSNFGKKLIVKSFNSLKVKHLLEFSKSKNCEKEAHY